MDDSRVIFKGQSQKGTPLLIRYPHQTDAQAMCDYINALSDERTYVSFQGEHMTTEDEQAYLDKQLLNIQAKKSVHLLVFSENILIGVSSIDLGTKTARHIGTLGISIAKNYRNQGIGKLLLEKILQEAKNELLGLKIVTLNCFANNQAALNLYRELGFIRYGTLPDGIILENGFADQVSMYKKIN